VKPAYPVHHLERRRLRGDTCLLSDQDVHFEWRDLRERRVHETLLLYDNIQDYIS
jgi:hypothetical protein